MQQLGYPCCTPGPCTDRPFVTVQQPPRIVVRKDVAFVKKLIPEPKLIQGMRRVNVPFVGEETCTVRVPQLSWINQTIREPCVNYIRVPKVNYGVGWCQKVINVPHEVCQPIVCHAQPQVIPVPPPLEYCCYPVGPPNINCCPTPTYGGCPPCPPYGACCPY